MFVRFLSVSLLLVVLALLTGCGAQPGAEQARRIESRNAELAAQVAQLQAELASMRTRVASLEAANATLWQSPANIDGSPQSSLPPLIAVAVETNTEQQPQREQPLDQTVYVTASGSKYHAASCRYARGATASPLSQAAIRLLPCSVCNPPTLSTTTPEASSSAAAAAPPAPSMKPAPAATSGGRCIATTQKGARCKRAAKPGSSYCWQHG